MLPQPEVTTAEQAIRGIEQEQLEAIVSRALDAPVSVNAWRVSLLGGVDSSPMAGGVYRVDGTARMRSTHACRQWRVVVKLLRSPQGFAMPDGTAVTQDMAEKKDSFGYWRREALVAESGLLRQLPGGLRAPRFLGVTPISETERWLWQTYLPADTPWTLADYRAAAYRLGQWQAAASVQPHYPWLSQGWLSGWVHGPLTGIFGIVDAMDGYRHPLLTAHFDPEELAALRLLWTNRQHYLDRVARLPKALCHLDAHRGNLSWQASGLALLDWAFVGLAARGEELAAFIGGTLLLDFVPLSEAETLEAEAFAGYIAGLRAEGWTGSEADIWEAYRYAMPLRYALASLASMLRTALQPQFAKEWERKTGKPLAHILAHRAGLVRFYMSRLEGFTQDRNYIVLQL